MPTARTCPNCGGRTRKRRSTTYPLVLPGRRIDVARVKVHECCDCGHLMPTPEGQDKLERCLQVLGRMLDLPTK